MKRWFWMIAAALVALAGVAGCSGKPAAKPAPGGLYVDVREASGISFRQDKPAVPLNILQTIGHGVAMVDADRDGLLDLVFVGVDQVRHYRNLGNYRFEDITAKSTFRSKGFWTGVAVGDVDNDGRLDLYLTRYAEF
ncbi:MAG: FG-GAP repeat domain-containing protein, partial [Armatimonadota bacterium]